MFGNNNSYNCLPQKFVNWISVILFQELANTSLIPIRANHKYFYFQHYYNTKKTIILQIIYVFMFFEPSVQNKKNEHFCSYFNPIFLHNVDWYTTTWNCYDINFTIKMKFRWII